MSEPRRAQIAVSLMFIFNGGLFGAWASRIPAVQEHFALSEAGLGLLLLGLAGGAIMSFPVAGRMCDRFGAARVTKVTALVYAPTMVLIAVAPTLPLLALAIFAFGASHGAMDIAMNGWGAEAERAADRPIMSLLHAMFSLGAGLGAGVGAAAASFGMDYGWHLSLFALLTALLVWPADIPWQSDRPQQEAQHKILALPTQGLLLVAIVALCSSLGEGAMADWSAVYLVEILRAEPGTAALGYAVFSVAMVTMRLIGDHVTKHFGAANTVRICGLAVLSGSLLALTAGHVWMALAGFAIMGVGYAIVMPLVFSRAANDRNTSAGAALAGVATFGYGGLLLGPPLIGFLSELLTLRAAFATLAVLALVIILGSHAFPPRSRL